MILRTTQMYRETEPRKELFIRTEDLVLTDHRLSELHAYYILNWCTFTATIAHIMKGFDACGRF